MHRFFITPAQRAGQTVRFNDEQAHQLRRVLRARPGERVFVLDGAGWQAEITLDEVSAGRVVGRITAESAAGGEPVIRLTLFQSLLKREKFEWVLQKGTEVGVAVFAPVITRRGLVRGDEVGPEKLDRWRRIVKEAAEQAGRGALPELRPPVTFAAATVEAAARGEAAHDRALLAWEGDGQPLREVLRGAAGGRVALFIGPEGGYDPAEVAQAEACGITPVTLGRRVLRTETAAIVGAALVLYELGEMG